MARPILQERIDAEADVVAVRQRARHLAELLRFDRQDQTRIATAVSEIARNAFAYARGGEVQFALANGSREQMLMIRVTDRGPGIQHLDQVLDAGQTQSGRSGMGLIAARRLMDHFTIESSGQGTVVELGQRLPASAKLTPNDLARILERLSGSGQLGPLAAMHEQNNELLQSLEELKRRQEETDQLARELGDTNRGVVALYAELEERAEQLKQASELKSRFLSNMSHEFRTPLNSILALCRILLDRIDGDLTEEQARQIGYIRKSADSLLELVNDLLDLAKVEAGKLEVKPVEFTVGDLFGGLRGALKPLSSNAPIELVFSPGSRTLRLYTDEAKVAQVLRNFISNALKFTERGTVRVSAAFDEAQDEVRFEVRDTGIGIAPADQERIFEEFTQIEGQLQRKHRGTGLGLPLSRKLAELLGGSVEVHSELGQGSTFTLVIPASLGGRRALEEAVSTQGKCILIVDDDETSRYVLRQMIGAHHGYELLEASGGEKGLQLMAETIPDLLILDLQMPEIDGFAVLRRLQLQPELAAVPVVVSTSMPLTNEVMAQLPRGIRILPKSTLSRETVLTVLREVLGE
ncbi:MAG: ATP-binding protein [Steroidobacteraceae bacterium]